MIKKEIHKMMKYLGLGKTINRLDQNSLYDTDQTTFTLRLNGKCKFVQIIRRETYSLTNDDIPEHTRAYYLKRIHENLAERCQEKAKQKLISIELANQGLPWCMYENKNSS